MDTPKRCPVCAGKIEICGGCKVDLTEAAIKALKKTGYDPTIKNPSNAKSIKKWIVTLCFLLSVSSYAQECCIQVGECLPWSIILGQCLKPCTCPPPPTPTPTPTPVVQKEIKLKWLSPLTNYVESPWMMKDYDAVYVGGHGGYCCGERPDGQFPEDVAFVIRYTNEGAKSNSLVLPDARESDDHEIGGYSPIIIGDTWWLFGSRTEMSYWGSKGNRLRPMLVKTKDPIGSQWNIRRDPPLYYPVDPVCKEMGSCEGIGNSQNSSVIVDSDGRILILSKDDVGTMNPTSRHVVYEIDKATGNGTYLYTANFGTAGGKPYQPSFSEWAKATDGSYLAYTGDQPVSNWYRSNTVVEWKSVDVGRNWWKTGRTWKPTGIQCLWDVAVMRNRDGLIAQPFTIVGIASDQCEFATVQSAWYLWFYSEDKRALPKTFGMIPESPPTPTYNKTGLIDYYDRPLVMKYRVHSDYCIYIHHDSGPWLGKETVFCGRGGPAGVEYTEKHLSLKGCGPNCQVPPHKCSVQGWGIYEVDIYNENMVRPDVR